MTDARIKFADLDIPEFRKKVMAMHAQNFSRERIAKEVGFSLKSLDWLLTKNGLSRKQLGFPPIPQLTKAETSVAWPVVTHKTEASIAGLFNGRRYEDCPKAKRDMGNDLKLFRDTIEGYREASC